MQKAGFFDAYTKNFDPHTIHYRPFIANESYQKWDINDGPKEHLHRHRYLEIGYCYYGHGVLCTEGSARPFSAPCISFLLPGQFHSEYSTGSEPCRWIFLGVYPEVFFEDNPAVLAAFSHDVSEPSLPVSHDIALVSLMQEIAEEYTQNRDNRDACVRAFLEILLLRHSRAVRESHMQTVSDISQKMLEALDYINLHYTERIGAEDIAAAIGLHSTTLRLRFKETFGTTPVQYIRQLKISAACSLLAGTRRPVTEIATAVGYDSLSSFNRNFLEICGCAPSEYRKKSLNKK